MQQIEKQEGEDLGIVVLCKANLVLQKEKELYLEKGHFLVEGDVCGASDLEALEDEDAEKPSGPEFFKKNFCYIL